MITIHKFPIDAGAGEAWMIETGFGHFKPLCVGLQGVQPMLWAEVEAPSPEQGPPKQRLLLVIGTGEYVPEGAAYIGTLDAVGDILHYYMAP